MCNNNNDLEEAQSCANVEMTQGTQYTSAVDEGIWVETSCAVYNKLCVAQETPISTTAATQCAKHVKNVLYPKLPKDEDFPWEIPSSPSLALPLLESLSWPFA